MIHLNSLRALRTSGKELNSREKDIVLFFASHPGQRTDRQLAADMGFGHRSAVQPRVSTLIKNGGILEQVGTTRCRVTGKTVRLVDLSANARAALPASYQREEHRGRPTLEHAAAKAQSQPALF